MKQCLHCFASAVANCPPQYGQGAVVPTTSGRPEWSTHVFANRLEQPVAATNSACAKLGCPCAIKSRIRWVSESDSSANCGIRVLQRGHSGPRSGNVSACSANSALVYGSPSLILILGPTVEFVRSTSVFPDIEAVLSWRVRVGAWIVKGCGGVGGAAGGEWRAGFGMGSARSLACGFRRPRRELFLGHRRSRMLWDWAARGGRDRGAWACHGTRGGACAPQDLMPGIKHWRLGERAAGFRPCRRGRSAPPATAPAAVCPRWAGCLRPGRRE